MPGCDRNGILLWRTVQHAPENLSVQSIHDHLFELLSPIYTQRICTSPVQNKKMQKLKIDCMLENRQQIYQREAGET